MRVLLHHPWGRFDAACGAGHTALALLDYFRAREWDVECVMQAVPAWGIAAAEGERALALDCEPVAPGDYGNEFRALLYASDRCANTRAFRRLAREPWDVFVTTDVCAAPFAHALPAKVLKVLATGDSYARRAATAERVPPAVRDAEQRFAFGHVEAELYRLFDRVLLTSEADASAARKCGAKSARHLPVWVREPEHCEANEEHDLLICGSARSGDLADAEWFYRHVYLPHLRACGVRLTLAGAISERFPVNDLRVTKSPDAAGVYEQTRVVVAPAHEAAGPHPAVMHAMARGRAVVTTPLGLRALDAPGDAVIDIDMRADPAGTASVIRELLAAPGWRKALGARAAQLPAQHSRTRFFAALDAAWEQAAPAPRVAAEAA